jgi:hypothetical protein
VWELILVDNLNIVQLDVHVLIHGVQRARDCQIVLQLHSHLRMPASAAVFVVIANCVVYTSFRLST